MRETIGAASGLVRLAFLVQNVYAEVGRGCDLTEAQARMLCVLTNGSVGMAELSSHALPRAVQPDRAGGSRRAARPRRTRGRSA